MRATDRTHGPNARQRPSYRFAQGNLGIALGAWIGGLIVEGMGLAAAPYLGALIVAIGIALTRLSGRLDNAATPRCAVAAE